MKKAKSHQIDEKGKRLLRELIPSTWVMNEQFSDYGKDFLVEVGQDDDELTGESFYLQLKSTKSLRLNADKSIVSFSLKSSHARYFVKIKDLPVFLVVMDVEAGVGYYLFLQQWLSENQDWNNQGTTTISVPTSRILSNSQQFSASIVEAKDWLRARYPTSLANAANAEIENLKNLDARFDITTKIEDGKVFHNLRANTKLEVKFAAEEGKAIAAQKLRDFVELGKTVQFEPGEFKIEGSNLLAVANETGCQLSNDGYSAKLILRVQTATEEYVSPAIDCHVKGGSKLSIVETRIPNCPLSLELKLHHAEHGQAEAKLMFQASLWEGKSVCQLPHFKMCYELFRALEGASTLQFEVEHEGNQIACIPGPNLFADRIPVLCEYAGDLQRVRKLCSYFGVNPVWSMNSFCNQYLFFCQVESMVFNGSWAGPSVFETVNGILDSAIINKEVRSLRSKPSPITVSSRTAFNFLDVQIPLGRVEKCFTCMKLKKCKKLQKRSKSIAASESEVEFVSTPDSTLTMRIIEPMSRFDGMLKP